jgi:hypothetical protein
MKSNRKKLGILLIVLAVAALFALPAAGISLLTMSQTHFVDTGVTTQSLQWHWPTLLIAALFATGLGLLLYPLRATTTDRAGR